MDFEVIIYIFVGIGIFFALPSTIYTFMFLGVFYRRKTIMLEKDDLKNTQYYPFAKELRNDILLAREIPCEKVKLKAKDGVTLFARYYSSSSDKAIIFVHGYQSNAFNNFATAMVDFLNNGYHVLLIDQRAHGNSGGRFTTLGCREKDDLRLWIEYVDRKPEINHIVIYGVSMGATTVGYACEKITSSKVKGLIMEAGFTCFYDELVSSLSNVFMKKAALNYVYLMSKSLLKVDIKQSIEHPLRNNRIPALFLHGDTDNEVSMEFTKKSFSACAAKKQFITVKGAGHTLCYLAGGEPLRNSINEFIDDCINKR